MNSETIKSDESVHGGDIYGFFLANQKRYQKAVIEKGRVRIDHITYSLSWTHCLSLINYDSLITSHG